jgi:hypothetical protein
LPLWQLRGAAVSHFSGRRIAGRLYILDDGITLQPQAGGYVAGAQPFVAITLGEAVMWASLHPFSPLLSGSRMDPF